MSESKQQNQPTEAVPRAAESELLGLPVDPGEPGVPVIVDALEGPSSVVPEAETIVLELGDLLPDALGEVVLFASDDFPVNILADRPVAESGIAPEHVTATGVDVTGLLFYSFEGGITLYSPHSLSISVDTDIT